MRPSLLIVDDKHDMLKLLERIVRGELDVDVYSADNGKDALDIILRKPVSVVLADVRMPGMDGIELLRRIKKSNDSAIVMMMTAYGTVWTAVESLKLGAYDFVTKPFDEERLLHTI
ncbi:MAG: response regulator [Nitrospirae bacterium]|nr:response regulator [Nitrospirota bacterium]